MARDDSHPEASAWIPPVPARNPTVALQKTVRMCANHLHGVEVTPPNPPSLTDKGGAGGNAPRCGPDACVSPQIRTLKPNPRRDGGMSSWDWAVSCEGGALTKGIRLLVKGTPESSVRPPAR